jgi:hypothetical protein
MVSGNIHVLLGNGDGTFRQGPIVPLPALSPQETLLAADLTGDGRPDFIVAGGTSIRVALGAGDGTFQGWTGNVIATGGDFPYAVVAGDFTGDGKTDLAIANELTSDVSILLGNGDGTFRAPLEIPVGPDPIFLVTGDFNGDGRLDLGVTFNGSGKIQILLGNGDGTFQNAGIFSLGIQEPIVAGDFTGDGRDDIATTTFDPATGQIAVALYRFGGDGTFLPPLVIPTGATGGLPNSLWVGDFNQDGHLGLATNTFNPTTFSSQISLLLGNGDGTFQKPIQLSNATWAANYAPLVTGAFTGLQFSVAADLTGNGQSDQIGLSLGDSDVSVALAAGDGTFLPTGVTPIGLQSTPLVGDLSGKGVDDLVVLNQAGQILFRRGITGQPGVFAAPAIVNPDARQPARAIALVPTNGGTLLAALDAMDSTISLYAYQPDGTFRQTARLAVPGALPAHLSAADLTGDGLGDLVVTDVGSNQVLVYLQTAPGVFGAPTVYSVGIDPSAIELADVNGDGLPDTVVTNQFFGDVSVLLNEGNGHFSEEERYRAGNWASQLSMVNGATAIQSVLGTGGVVAGRFDEGDPSADLVVTNSSADSFALLRGDGTGGFLNPASPATFATGSEPTVVVTGDFTGDGHLDLAILNTVSDTISIYLGDGHGGFTFAGTIDAGNSPTGLSVADINGDGKLDLLVGNSFGDVLILYGKGDGTFAPYQRADQAVSLAVASSGPGGQSTFIFGNQALDEVALGTALTGAGIVRGSNLFQTRSDGVKAPGQVQLADLNGDGIPDLIVANSGGNDVLVYLGLGGGRFEATPLSFFAGTDPVSVTVADLTGNGIPDLVVANEGSNDLTILLGKGTGANWTLTEGPRLKSGGLGPTSVAVRDVFGDGIPDLLVSNSQSNTVSLLRGLGGGFFNDQNPTIFNTGIDPRQVLVGNFDGTGGLDLLTVNAGSNDLTLISNFTTAPVTSTIASGGTDPVAAVAGDFNGSGRTDLLVANNGDGVISLLLGGPEGLTRADTFSNPALPHPSDVALSFVNGDVLQFYVTEQGQDLAVGFEMSFAQSQPVANVEASGGLLATVLLSSSPSPLVAASETAPAPGLPGFFIGSDRAFLGVAPAVAATALNGGDAPPQSLRDALDAIFQRWLPATVQPAENAWQAVSSGPRQVLRTLDKVFTALGIDTAPLADIHVQGLVKGLADVLVETGRALGTGVRSWWRDGRIPTPEHKPEEQNEGREVLPDRPPADTDTQEAGSPEPTRVLDDCFAQVADNGLPMLGSETAVLVGLVGCTWLPQLAGCRQSSRESWPADTARPRMVRRR